MKKRDGLILREVGDQTVVVPTGAAVADLNGLVSLNASGRWLWDRIGPGESAESLAQGMTAEFEVDEETARRDVGEFLADLRRMGILEP